MLRLSHKVLIYLHKQNTSLKVDISLISFRHLVSGLVSNKFISKETH